MSSYHGFTQEELDRADEILDELGVRPAAW
jgi:hypothetical protein